MNGAVVWSRRRRLSPRGMVGAQGARGRVGCVRARSGGAWRSGRGRARALEGRGQEGSRTLVGQLLNETGYSLQGNRKTTEGDSHPDRDAQFGYINSQVTAALAEQQPVISVDTKKKELVGDFRNNGREYRPQGNPEEVRVHDFLLNQLP